MLEINICDVFLFDQIHSDIFLRTVNFVVRSCGYQSKSVYARDTKFINEYRISYGMKISPVVGGLVSVLRCEW